MQAGVGREGSVELQCGVGKESLEEGGGGRWEGAGIHVDSMDPGNTGFPGGSTWYFATPGFPAS